MSDYMFMLENHLTSAQNRVLAEVRREALEENVNVFLTGGAVRDMLGGFPIGDLDFTVEGNALRLAKTVADRMEPRSFRATRIGRRRNSYPRKAQRSRSGWRERSGIPRRPGSPTSPAATIQEDLLRRDFTINALALSLNRASRGLLLDPTNGMGDLERREIRTTSSYVFYDSPMRLLRLWRFKVRLGFTLSEKTVSQYRNARESELENFITRPELLSELQKAATEPNIAELLQAWDEEKLLDVDFACAGRAGAEFARFREASEIPSNATVRNWLADRRGRALLCDTDRETHPQRNARLSLNLIPSTRRPGQSSAPVR